MTQLFPDLESLNLDETTDRKQFPSLLTFTPSRVSLVPVQGGFGRGRNASRHVPSDSDREEGGDPKRVKAQREASAPGSDPKLMRKRAAVVPG